MRALGLSPSGATTAGLFRPGGHFDSVLPDPIIDLLPEPLQHVAIRIARYWVKKERAHELDERVTDKVIAEATGLSERSVRRALHALHVVLGALAQPIIDRIRRDGRRIHGRSSCATQARPKPATDRQLRSESNLRSNGPCTRQGQRPIHS